jgi:hypothetical protein
MRDRASLQRPRGLRFPVGVVLLCLVALGLVAPAVRAATPVYPTPVPYDQLENVPYRHAGLVRTESYGADPTVLGSRWVAGERVVASAAHVFYVDETLGWNRNRWYWRRAAPRRQAPTGTRMR